MKAFPIRSGVSCYPVWTISLDPIKRALRAASVLGQRFEPDALRNVLGDDSYDWPNSR